MKYILLLTLAALNLAAPDATGTWRGMFTPAGRDPQPALLLLKQDGPRLTGSGGPDQEEQHPISNGKVEDGKITFQIQDVNLMEFDLKLDGDHITGTILRKREGQTDTATLDVTRAK